MRGTLSRAKLLQANPGNPVGMQALQSVDLALTASQPKKTERAAFAGPFE